MVKALADPGPPPLDGDRSGWPAPTEWRWNAFLPGLVVVGSYVPLADQQLERLLQDPGCHGLALPVPSYRSRPRERPTPDLLLMDLEREWLQQLQRDA